MKNAYIGYTRCSTEEQKKGTSHDYQKSGILRSARVDDMDCLGWYSDTMTGTTTVRDGLTAAYQFLQKLQKQKHNYKKLYLIAYKTDRFGRNVEECFGTIRKFKELGVEVNFADEWADYKDDNTSILLAIRFGMAESESKKIGSRIRDGNRQMLQDGGYPHKIPVGYKRIPTGEFRKNKPVKKIVKDEAISESLTAMFTDYLTGSFTKKELNRKYAQTLGVARSQFYEIFECPFYAALFPNKHGDENEYIKLNTPQYLTQSEFEQMQQITIENGKGNKGKTWTLNVIEQEERYYLKGVLKCLLTGGTMTSTKVKKQNGNVYEYYQTAKAEHKQVIPINFAHTLVEKAISEIEISKTDSERIEKEMIVQLREQTKMLRKELQKINSEIETASKRIENMTNQFADGAISADMFRELSEKFKFQQNAQIIRKTEIELILTETEQPIFQALKFMKSIGFIFKQASTKKRNQILKALFPRGFKINPSKSLVQTEKINIFVNGLIANCSNYTFLKIENEDNCNDIPLVRSVADDYQTEILIHKQLIISLLDAA